MRLKLTRNSTICVNFMKREFPIIRYFATSNEYCGLFLHRNVLWYNVVNLYKKASVPRWTLPSSRWKFGLKLWLFSCFDVYSFDFPGAAVFTCKLLYRSEYHRFLFIPLFYNTFLFIYLTGCIPGEQSEGSSLIFVLFLTEDGSVLFSFDR